jgi:hypothetical protein
MLSVKGRHAGKFNGHRRCFAEGMLALPHLSGDELVAALQSLGFHTRARAAGLATMARHGNAVVVPETATLSPALVAAILRTAQVEPYDFARAIERGAMDPAWLSRGQRPD